MASSLTATRNAILFLDTMAREPTRFEANVLETVTRQLKSQRGPSPAQHRILCEMVAKYVGDPFLLRALQQEAP